MGLSVLSLEIANQPNPRQTETVEFLIDSGAIYSVVPRPILQRLGIEPVSEQDFRLASGQTIRRQTAGALFNYRDKVGVEALGLALDPIRRELVPLPMMLAFLPSTTES